MPNYLFEKVDIPGGSGANGFVYISVVGVDAAGLAVGNVGDTDGDWHGFTVAPDQPWTQYDPPNSSNNTEVVGITDSGEIYGDYTDWSNVQHGFVVNSGVTTTIDVPFATATYIAGATASGELFGSYVYGGELVEGFIDNNGAFTTVIDPAGQSTNVSAVNASGVIVGTTTDSQFVAHAFVDNGGTFTTLNPPGSYSSSAVGVTASGEVVGTYQDTANDQYGFIYNNGAFTKIAVAGSIDNVVSYVSASGEIVGYYVDSSGHIDGFIDQNGTITTVNVPGATDTEIMGINAAGEIYGDYNDNLGQHGFVGLPEPLNISVTPTAAQAVQGGPAIAVLSGAPDISDTSSTILSSATIAIANAGGNPVTGDELTINGQQSGTVDDGLVTVSWNDTTKTLTLTGNAALADYQTLLSEISYQDTGTDASSGSHPFRDVTWTVNDGTFSNSTTSEITIDRAPVATVANITLNPNGMTAAASTMVTASDPDGDPITTYAFQDTGNGHFILNGAVEPNNQEIDVTAAQLSQLTYQGTGGTDTAEVRVSDGTSWSGWESFTITGPAATPIQTDGTTELAQIGNYYYLDNTSTGIGPEVKQASAPVIAGAGGWAIIDAIQVAGGGYDVAWKETGADQYTVWSLDANGNQTGNIAGGVITGESATLENFETIFGQDLNGDGHVGPPPPPPPVTVSTDGTTTLVQSGNNYFLEVTGSNTLGHEVKQAGAPVTAGAGGWTIIDAVQVSGGGYDVAWKETGADQYTVWSLDANGNQTGNIAGGAVTGESATLENFETIFGQDLNGDGHVGPPPPPPPVTVSTDGTTTLVQSGNNYFLEVTGSNTLGPEVKQAGAPVTAGAGGWTIIDAIQVAGGGYDVAWKETGVDQYTVWSLDANGNQIGNIAGGVITGESATLENFETIFGQDLNGDGHVGPPPPPPPVTVSTDGTTTLVQSGNNYFLEVTGSNTLGPEVKQAGAPVIAGAGGWTIIDAIQVAGGGYDVAWKETGANQYTVWSLDANGNQIGNIAGGVITGESATLENFETIFGQDLNGDGHVGPPPPPPPVTVSTDGTTTLVQSGNNNFLEVTGSNTLGPEVKQAGAPVIAGAGGWTIIDAIQVAGGGYDVAWKETGADQYTVWSLDANGNQIGNIAGGVITGESATLENFETIFGQDLNGDGHVGIATTSQTASSSATLTLVANSTPDNFQFTSGNNGATGQTPVSATSQGRATAMAGHDGFVFVADHDPAGTANSMSWDATPPANSAAAHAHAASTEPHEDAFGASTILDAAHTAQWLAHHNGFHFI